MTLHSLGFSPVSLDHCSVSSFSSSEYLNVGGPQEFIVQILYIHSLGDLIQGYSFKYYLHADKTQIYPSADCFPGL